MIRVLIVASYASVRAGLHAFLADADDISIVGEVGGGADLEPLLSDLRPDVVLYDQSEGEEERLLDALEAEAVGVVLLGESSAGYQMLAERPLPGWAYLLKEAEGREIAGAVRAVAAGLIALDRSLVARLRRPEPLPDLDEDDPISGSDEVLTLRELQVLQLMAQGLPNKIIAARLSISLHTVKFHVASILAKLGASSRTEAVTLGARRGLIVL